MMEIDYTLQWEDERLSRHPCFGALQKMLSMDREAGKSDKRVCRAPHPPAPPAIHITCHYAYLPS